MDYKEFLEKTIKECKSKADFCRALDKKPTGGNYKTIDKIIKDYNLDTSHFTHTPWNKGIRYFSPKYDLDEILVKDSPHNNTYALKLRLFKEGLKEPKCEICGYSEKVELHHINGDSSDNRLENLQILCPNCHSKTENFRNNKRIGRTHKNPKELILEGEDLRIHDEAKILAKRKGIKIFDAENLIKNSPNKSIDDFSIKTNTLDDKVCPTCGKTFHPKNKGQIYCSTECFNKTQSSNIPSRDDLIEKLIELKCNFTATSKFYNVTDNAVKKWCVKYGMPKQKSNLIDYLNNLNNPDYIKPIETKKNRKYDKDLICKIYLEGYSQKEIAKFIGCCQDTVAAILKEHDIPLRKGSCKKIGQYSLDGNLINYFYGANEAGRWLTENNVAESAHSKRHVIECCNLQIKQAYGYIWKWEKRIPIEEIK